MSSLSDSGGERERAADSAPARRGYPRPQLRRKDWLLLDGPWELALDRDGEWKAPREVTFDRTIVVPFAPETALSGVGETGYFTACWYRWRGPLPPPEWRGRTLLHFGAVDYAATVWIDGQLAGSHEGGYTPFTVDVTDWATAGDHEIVVRAVDDPLDLEQPRGKQDWKLEPHSIWYPRTTGIWQSVWLERVPETRIGELRWTSNLERWEIEIEARVAGRPRDGLRLAVRLTARVDGGERVLADDSYAVLRGEVTRRIALSDPGIDDARNELLWSPERPCLLRAQLRLIDADGTPIDEVDSYTAIRSVSVQGDRVLLNGRPYPMLLVLDQGYWADGGLTAPSDEALRRDVELAKAMGFNGVRKHQKIEDPRYLYWADRLGLLVWEEMPSAYRFTSRSVDRVAREWREVIARDRSHPCIVAWVPFNESWGVPNLPDSAPERHYVQALYHLTKALDPTRPVIGNDGWEVVATDIIGIHDYDADAERLALRYRDPARHSRLLRRERPGGRLILLPTTDEREHPWVLSEFGGIALADEKRRTWGYARAHSQAQLADRYEALLAAVRSVEAFSGFCYTQFADTYQEANGLLHEDRTPKFPLERMRVATRGAARIARDAFLQQQAADPPRQEGLLVEADEP